MRFSVYNDPVESSDIKKRPEQHIMSNNPPPQRIVDALQERRRTWDELKELTKLNDERLGFALGDLLDQRKIWTMEKSGIRFYGIEKRTNLVPRFPPPHQRRSTDRQF
jgi:hypothetical protein